MSTVPLNAANTETAPSSRVSTRSGDLRGVQWRIDLGILPSYPSASIDDLRRVTANSRRRYAALRRKLLIDPHVPKDGSNSLDLVVDNPLSQNPDSMWGRFFRNAELERMVDQDLTRLYPERGYYFQTTDCQAILRRILLLWCLRHPEYGYRQGMHELLAPLLYVLHVDAQRLSEIHKMHDDHFPDKPNSFSFHESDFSHRFDFKKVSNRTDDNGTHNPNDDMARAHAPDELDPSTETLVALSDAYGAEGELGIVTSNKFLEHDAYAMFDSLLGGGGGGALALSDFFFHSAASKPHSGPPPVIEASAALYHLLSTADPSLHAHLVEIGVEPQYFALRWLRVLFGREFSLEDLLSLWDKIFERENTKTTSPTSFGVLESARGAFVCAFGVSMILHLRSSLLATENATACLQRLLNFPEDVSMEKLLEKAGLLHELALKSNDLALAPVRSRGHSLSLGTMVAGSYWEERWRVVHEEDKKADEVPYRKNGWSERMRLHISRTESDPTPSKERNKASRPHVRRSLLEDLARQLGSDEDKEDVNGCNCNQNNDERPQEPVEACAVEDLNTDKNNYENASSIEENSSGFSEPVGPVSGNSENGNERSSVGSNSSVDENDCGPCVINSECSTLPISDPTEDLSSQDTETRGSLEEVRTSDVKERKVLSSKLQWLWKFGRNGGEGTSNRKSGSVDKNVAVVSSDDGCEHSIGTNNGKTVDQNLMVSLKNLGQSMLENIQVIESVFQQENGGVVESPENLGEGQVTAMAAALKELRKISNLLSEM